MTKIYCYLQLPVNFILGLVATQRTDGRDINISLSGEGAVFQVDWGRECLEHLILHWNPIFSYRFHPVARRHSYWNAYIPAASIKEKRHSSVMLAVFCYLQMYLHLVQLQWILTTEARTQTSNDLQRIMLPAILHISHAWILWALWKHTARDLLADWNNILW